MSLTKSGTRGCGDRKAGGAYLCLGVSEFGTLTVEDLIKDPALPYDTKWLSRGAAILPREKGNPHSIHDVYMVVDSKAYPSFWSFVEEARELGISKRISSNFSFKKLTPGQSYVRLIFRRGIPKFDYSVDVDLHIDHHPFCKAYDSLKHAYPHIDQMYGLHIVGNAEDYLLRGDMDVTKLAASFCTFSHQDIDVSMHDWVGDGLDVTRRAFFPSKEDPTVFWDGYNTVVADDAQGLDWEEQKNCLLDTNNWLPALCMEFVLSHVEISQLDNPKVRKAAWEAGYDAIVTEH